MSKYNELVKKLKEIFQIDRPELDFGIYRILNARADEINDYLDNKLKAKIQSALADAGDANKADLEQQLQAAIKAATDAGFEPGQSPKVQELKAKLAATASGVSEHENAVFSHLLTFFSRYYDNGDFISKRRYKGDTYAIPYAGEEVMLHWANKDQYYIKSGENFANYSFKLDDGRKVNFKLLAADTAKDNRKDNDADRRFVLIKPHTRTKIDDNGEEYEQAYQPVEVVKTTEFVGGESVEKEELVIHFEYKAMKKGTKQETLISQALSEILSNNSVQSNWVTLSQRHPTESDPSRTLLAKHLTAYSQVNSADYFIHRNLKLFLTNELDFYIKNEVMNLDNIQVAEVFNNIERQLRVIQCLRTSAVELIEFLSQLENFQKKLWNKKKFAVSTEYLVTVDYLNSEQLAVVLNNKSQWEQWLKLGLVDSVEGTIEKLKDSKGLTIDTSLFDQSFKLDLLNNIDQLDDKINGTLIHGDNYQALNLLQQKYNQKIDGIYIDPPYNTDASAILYKNGFKDSSWLSLMLNRLELAKPLMKDKTLITVAIDDEEVAPLRLLLGEVFPKEAGIGVVKVNPQSRKTKGKFSPVHEYALFYGNSDESIPASIGYDEAKLARYPLEDDLGRYSWMNFIRAGSNDKRQDRPKLYYPIVVTANDDIRIPKMEWDDDNQEYIVLENISAEELLLYPDKFVDGRKIEKNWQRGHVRVAQEYSEYRVRRDREGNVCIDFKTRMDANAMPTTWWDKKEYASANYGAAELKELFGEKPFDFPKAKELVEKSILACIGKTEGEKTVLDFFAGSGTTAHASLNLRRSINDKLKFIVVEQGEYFDSVIKPRVQKVNYSPEWKASKPVSKQQGLSSVFKILKIESYEDTLNSIVLKKPEAVADLFTETNKSIENEYLVKYMFKTESHESLLNTEDFKKPFDYKMDIATDSAGATERKSIDLVETFNYLIGLHVKSIESNIERGFVRLEGTLPTGERTLILWRDCDKIGYDKLNEYANRFDLYAKEQTFDVIYINGDHNLPTAFTVDGEDGEVMRSLKLRQIEPEFLSLMFAEEA
ncbi:TPA: site-specific DNA-methyltransferase [Vibrio parahaemolyticus]|nr:site-specific DNA-methyltransferase [Vibrio parahaemolyticus]HBC3552869.1 site-specific DNA-methyltransferase [Vibrio parahaemolyticus]HBK3325485.1 site-specific DNA-methyltransferase [Vibrio parahaemolyticus]HCM0781363.1 site-specific DNA-methyltransferase [Vibrio parahaemolyticus]HCM1202222.1 site-specific DNA-methyltransferase [Vibrio parahaemolyticus]